MKQPTLRHLKIDREGTELIRTALRKKGRVTITVNLDAADLCAAKTRSKKAGISYQRMVKTLLTTTVSQQESIEFRLARLEPELRKLKRYQEGLPCQSHTTNILHKYVGRCAPQVNGPIRFGDRCIENRIGLDNAQYKIRP